MKKLLLLCTLAISFNANETYAQTCGSDAINASILSNPQEMQRREIHFKQFMDRNITAKEIGTRQRVTYEGQDSIIEIPLVFHILHTGSAIGTNYNPSVAKIDSVVEYLNQSFEALFPTGPIVGGVNVPVRFALAKRDPQGQPTNGITRTNVSYMPNYVSNGVDVQSAGGVSDDVIKSIIRWNSNYFYNIYVVNKIDGWDGYVLGQGVAGYAYMPYEYSNGFFLDGTVVTEAFNRYGSTVLVHELGHALNLHHTFQGGCVSADQCDTTGDFVCDTDPHHQTSGCPSTNNCNGVSQATVSKNIMNYTTCADRFTPQQSERMEAAVKAYRPGLLNSTAALVASPTPSVTLTPLVSSCVPTFGNGNYNTQTGIRLVRIGDFSAYSSDNFGENNQYFDHSLGGTFTEPLPAINLEMGETYSIEVGTSFNNESVVIYLDLNNDGTFTSNEFLYGSASPVDSYRSHVGTITIPSSSTVVTGSPIRMRVRSSLSSNSSNISICGNASYGQAEDFAVVLSVPLSMDAFSFEAKAKSGAAVLNWQFKNNAEDNYHQFVLERSFDKGKSFVEIARVDASADQSQYQFIDQNIGSNFSAHYRLQLMERSGNMSLSDVKAVSFVREDQKTMNLFPNPAQTAVTIKFASTDQKVVSIRNVYGQVVYEQNVVGQAEVKVDLSAWSAGVYFVSSIDHQGFIVNQTFTKK